MSEKIIIKLTGDTKEFEGALAESTSKIGRLKSAASSVGAGLKTAASVGAVAFTALVGGITAAISAYREQEQAEIRTRKTIEATGKAAGLTAEEIFKMASNLQKVTTFGDETILGGQNLLLTFRNIGSDVFPRATEAMLDMSTAMGTDVKSSAIQLGKALNDPTEGISALTRAGITFSDAQKSQIKSMQQMGDTAGAQAVILKELENQFGGVSRAATGGTGKIVQVKNILGDIAEAIGKAAMPAVKVLGDQLIKLSDYISGSGEAFTFLSDTMRVSLKIAAQIKAVFITVGEVIGTFLAGSFEVASDALSGNFSQALEKTKMLGDELGDIMKNNKIRLNEDLADIDKSFEDQKKEEQANKLGAIAEQSDLETEVKLTKQQEQQQLLQEQELASKAEHDAAIEVLNKTKLQNLFQAERANAKADLTAKIKENNQRLQEEQKYGTAHANMLAFFRTKQLEGTGMLLDNLATLGQSGDRRLMAIAKAASIARAFMNIAEGVTKAFTYGPILGPALAASVAAAGAVQIGVISSQGFAEGGLVRGGIAGVDSVPAMLMPGETIVPRENFEQLISSFGGNANGSNNNIEITLTMKDNLIDFIQAELSQRQALNIGV